MNVKRPMLWLSASIVAGVVLLAYCGAAVSCTFFFCSVITVSVMLCRAKKTLTSLILIGSLLMLLAGILLFGIADDVALSPIYKYCGEQIIITGEIIDEPIISDSYTRFNIRAVSLSNGKDIFEKTDDKISAISYIDSDTANRLQPDRGDVVTVNCEVSLPDVAMNTGGFDYAKYLKSRGFKFQAVAKAESMRIIGHNKHIFSDAVHSFRKRCIRLFDTAFPESEGSVIKAYVLGDKSAISPEMSDAFSGSGLSHVLAVSGMHVSVFLTCILALLKMLKISKRKQLVVCAFAVVFFASFTGASIATLRAAFVCLTAVLAKLVFRHSDGKTALFEAAAVLCVINPHVVFDASFLLSFSSAFGILFFFDGMSDTFSFAYAKLNPSSKIRTVVKTVCDMTAVGISANLFVAVVMIYLFREFSVMSVIATVVINPVLTPMLAGGLLFTAVGLISEAIAYPIAGFLYVCAKFVIKIAELFAGLPFSKITFGGITPFFLLFYAMAVLTVYFTLVKRNEALFMVSLYSLTLLSVVYLFFSVSVCNVAQISFINVGNGDCSLIKAPGNCDILIDAGGKKKGGSVGEKVVKPYLIQNGVYDIEYVIASHGHEDHVNGIIELLDVMKIKNIIVPEGFGTTEESNTLLNKAKEMNIPVTYFKHGDSLKINDHMKLTAIMPDEKFLAFLNKDDENDRSLMLKLEYGDSTFLYTGDMSQNGEKYAAALYPDMISANVIKIGHHGSDTSSSEIFLDTVAPEFAFIPVGKNTYGHPNRAVLERLASRDIKFYRADQHKDVTFYFDESEIKGIQFAKSALVGGNYDLR